jgi:hypothetical protein
LPTAHCGPGSSAALVQNGATIEIVARSVGREVTLQALIDSGSELTVAEANYFNGWIFKPSRPGTFASMGAQASRDIFIAEIEIPTLNLRETTEVVLDNLNGRQAILGRNQLRNCVLVYDGPKGTVQLRR